MQHLKTSHLASVCQSSFAIQRFFTKRPPFGGTKAFTQHCNVIAQARPPANHNEELSPQSEESVPALVMSWIHSEVASSAALKTARRWPHFSPDFSPDSVICLSQNHSLSDYAKLPNRKARGLTVRYRESIAHSTQRAVWLFDSGPCAS